MLHNKIAFRAERTYRDVSRSISAQLRTIFVSRNQESGNAYCTRSRRICGCMSEGLTFTDILTRHTIAQPLHCHLNYWFTIEGGIHTHAHTRVGGQRIEGRRTRQVTGGSMQEIETRRKRRFFYTLGYFRLTPRLWHFFLLSVNVAAKICCSRLFRGGRFFLSLIGDASPPLLHPLLSPPSRIPFILISRSSSCICHLLSSLRDKYCLIVVILILFCRIVNQEFNEAFKYCTKNGLILE